MKKFPFPLTLLAIVIVFGAILAIFYANRLPFGLNARFEIIFGSNDDTLGNFRLLPSGTWGKREVESTGKTFREINGSGQVVLQPKYVLNKSTITVSVEGENVALYPKTISFNKNLITSWQYNWDLTTQVPSELRGGAFVFDGCTYFDGKSILSYDKSKELFETGPFSIYVEWMPTEILDYQQIVGHFNWEIFQSKNSVIFQLGKMKDTSSTFFSIRAPIDQTFFNKKHTLLVQYVPDNDNGYIEMFIDQKFIERKNIKASKIDTEYGDNNLTLGWSSHNYQQNPHFKGCVYHLAYAQEAVIKPVKELTYTSNEADATLNLVGLGKVYKAIATVQKNEE